jgi:PAS domain S-box-containing protein
MEDAPMEKKPTDKEREKKLKELDEIAFGQDLKNEVLKKSDEQYYQLFDNLYDVFYQTDVNGKIEFISPSIERIAGYGPDKLLGLNIKDLHIEPNNPEKMLRDIFSNGYVKQFEAPLKKKDGSVVWLSTNAVLLKDDEGNVLGIEGVSRDITERRQSEEALRKAYEELKHGIEKRTIELVKSNDRLKREIEERKRTEEELRASEENYRELQLVKHAPAGIYEIDLINQKFISVNDVMCEYTGYTREEFLSMNPFDILSADSKRHFSERLGKLFAGENIPATTEFKIRAKNGRELWVILNARFVFKNGKPVGSTVIIHDITERKIAEIESRESEEKYRLLVETMNDGLAVQDENGLLTYVNDKFCEMIGYSKDELINRPVNIFLDKDNQKTLKEQMIKRRKGESKPYEIVWTSKSLRKIPTIISPQSLFDSMGHFQGSFAVITDINELKRVEQELREREEELKIKTRNLEETNTALRVLLKSRDEDKIELEEKVLLNVKELVAPFLEKLKKSGMDEKQKAYVDILESNLNDITSPFSRDISSTFYQLTPSEIQVANLIKLGRTSKDIAELLNVSHRTIEAHRENIREKIGLKNKKANLRTHLLSLQ